MQWQKAPGRILESFSNVLFKSATSWTGLIIDIGANMGFYSLLGARASRDNQILAFEPDLSIMSSLEKNVSLSGLNGQVQFSTVAVSSKAGDATFYVPTQEHGLIETSSYLEPAFKSSHSELRSVKTDTLDSILLSSHAGKNVFLTKVDVEGYEPHVVMGAVNTVDEYRPILFVEVLGNADTAYLTSFIRDNNYIDVIISPDGLIHNTGNVEFLGNAWNHAFVPEEKLATFLGLPRI